MKHVRSVDWLDITQKYAVRNYFLKNVYIVYFHDLIVYIIFDFESGRKLNFVQ